MSRARPITFDGEQIWFDTYRNGEPASDEQVEMLASAMASVGEEELSRILDTTTLSIEGEVELDDLLDTSTFDSLSQGEVIKRLRAILGQDEIPKDVIEKRRQWRDTRHEEPACRICGKVGDSTKHHFVNKWILRELSNYAQKWAQRTKNCIPLCIHCHRDIHSRDEDTATSIAPYLTEAEKEFAQASLSYLLNERPRLWGLIACGDNSVYETRLIRDFQEGKFKPESEGGTKPLPMSVDEIREEAQAVAA